MYIKIITFKEIKKRRAVVVVRVVVMKMIGIRRGMMIITIIMMMIITSHLLNQMYVQLVRLPNKKQNLAPPQDTTHTMPLQQRTASHQIIIVIK